jgi:TPR repeat protein
VWARAITVLALSLVACAARHARTARGGGGSGGEASTEGASYPASADAGGLQACVRDAKDLSACVEDCDRGIATSCAILAARTHDATRAVSLHERACELKESASCVTAARMHASGSGVPPSRAKQLELMVTACTLGDAIACGMPAKAFATGNGVVRDERRARELWQRGCGGGVESACHALGDAGL